MVGAPLTASQCLCGLVQYYESILVS